MTTFTPPSASVTRRVAVGLSAGAQPADGVPELAQSAHEALMRAPWGESPAPPSMPVHDNGQTSNRSAPSGDAFKCGYGYDATNRTERAAAGAVCYTFALPRAMVAETDAAAVTGLTVRVIGDRYLDAGARVFATLTGSAIPPTFAEMLGAEAASAVVCATSGQTKPDGVTPLEPNNRAGVRADAEITPATPLAAPEGATAAYLHVCLALADYTTTRGAWIEGGAMLAPDTLRVTFDRDVEADSAKANADLTLGRFSSAADNAQSGPASRRQDTYALTISDTLLDTLTHDTADERAAHILAAALQTPSPLLATASLSQHNNAAFGIGQTSLASTVISRSGLVSAGTFTRVKCAAPFKAPCDALAHVFVVVGPTAMTAAAIDGAAEAATASVCLDWASVIRRDAFVAAPPSGSVARLSSGLSNGVFSDSASAPIELRHLGTAKLVKDGIYSAFDFSTPLTIETTSKELVTLVVQFAPVGPGGGIEGIQTTTRVLETLAYSDTREVASNDMDGAPSQNFRVFLGVALSPSSTVTESGMAAPSYIEITGGVQAVSLSVYSDATQERQDNKVYLPARAFEVNGHSLHFSAQILDFGSYGGTATVSPSGTNVVVYDYRSSTPSASRIDRTISAVVNQSAKRTFDIPVFETVDGVEVQRGSASVSLQFPSGTFAMNGGIYALSAGDDEYNPYDFYTDGKRPSTVSGSLASNKLPMNVSIQYYYEISEEVEEYTASETFALPEISLVSR